VRRAATGGGVPGSGRCCACWRACCRRLRWPGPGQAGALPGTLPPGRLRVVCNGFLAMLVLALQWSDRGGQAAWRGWPVCHRLAGGQLLVAVRVHAHLWRAAGLAGGAGGAGAGVGAGAVLRAGGFALCTAGHRVPRWLQALLFAPCGRWQSWRAGAGSPVFPGVQAVMPRSTCSAPGRRWVGVYGMGFMAAVLAYGAATVLTVTLGGAAALDRAARPAPVRAAAGAPVTGSWPACARSGRVLLWGAAAGQPAGRRRLAGARPRDTAMPVAAGLAAAGQCSAGRKVRAGHRRGRRAGLVPAPSWPRPWRLQGRRAVAPQLVVAPETALPLLPQQLGPAFWQPLLTAMAQPGPDPAVGVLIGLPLGSFEHGYTNSAWGIDRRRPRGRNWPTPGEALGRALKASSATTSTTWCLLASSFRRCSAGSPTS
jgi:apolipoprotein N-acyltransferase